MVKHDPGIVHIISDPIIGLLFPSLIGQKPGKTGLMMKFLKSEDDGAQYFTFDHNEEYRMVQLKFFEAVDSLHPDFIVHQSPALQILSSLYIGRSYHLWKEPKLLPW
ncbi:unnamed protein product [Lepeophtheirus salmonis]|uniref:(salmon louse) hypothetical protein n=1 Tax=Lepeophtheirus salmonis TaxID=72036 RepID=A0A7R8D1Q6_LEPSM|nr:unnamed protein product [Lepeophtheirus salmonis]CAF2997986.1 unnamed protein product [Lepeophtheirus salmonis]